MKIYLDWNKTEEEVLQFNWNFESLLVTNCIFVIFISFQLKFQTWVSKLLWALFITLTIENFHLASNWNLYFEWLCKRKFVIFPGKLIRIKWFWLFLLLMPLTSICCKINRGKKNKKSSLHHMKAFYVINLCKSYWVIILLFCTNKSITSTGWITEFLPFKGKCLYIKLCNFES